MDDLHKTKSKLIAELKVLRNQVAASPPTDAKDSGDTLHSTPEAPLKSTSDTVERQHAEEQSRLNEIRLETLLELGRMTDKPFREITDFALEKAVELTKSTVGYLAFVNDDETVLTMYSWSASAMRECEIKDKPLLYPVVETGLWGEAVRQRKPVFTNDYDAPNPSKRGYPEGHVRIHRHMNTPIFDGEHIVVVAGVGNKTEPYEESDLRQLTLLMDGMWRMLERKRMIEALRKERLFLRKIIDTVPSFIFVKDWDGRFTLVNKALADAYGTTVQNLVGKTDADFNVNENEVQQFLHNDREVISTRQDKLVLQEKITYANGEEHWLTTTKVPLVEDDDQCRQLLAVATDITERKKTEEEHRRFQAQVQHAQKLESLGVLAGGIAHDFNNLLVGMLGNAQLALMDLSPLSPVRDTIGNIVNAAQRAADLAKQMLAYSGKGHFIVEPLVISDLVEEMARMLEVSISKKAVLRYNFAPDLPAIQADATQLRQVIMNLITNASDALAEKDGVITISTGVMTCDKEYLHGAYLDDDCPPGVYVYMEVSDTGCGMGRETQSKIFDPFFTTKFTGRGLGLAAVLGIVRGHHGAIKVYSEQGRGTLFKVLFPATGLPSVSVKAKSQSPAGAHGHGMLLLVDDEEIVRNTAKKMLERIGYKVLVANDGREAVKIFETRRDEIQCVLLDLTMPHLDGEETFRRLCQVDPRVRVILASGYSEQEVTERFVGKGLAGFIQKPYLMETLINVLNSAIGTQENY